MPVARFCHLRKRRSCDGLGDFGGEGKPPDFRAVKAFSKSMTVVKTYDNWSCPRPLSLHRKMHLIFHFKAS